MLDFNYLPSYLGMVLGLSFHLISVTTRAGNFFLLFFSLNRWHHCHLQYWRKWGFQKTTKYGQTHGQGAGGEAARSPRHWRFQICPGMVHHWAFLINFQQDSLCFDGIHNMNQEKEREEKPCLLLPHEEWRWRNIQGSSQEETLRSHRHPKSICLIPG